MTVNNSWASGDVKFITAQNMLIRAVGGSLRWRMKKKMKIITPVIPINPFHANVPFLHPLKMSENQTFSDIFLDMEIGHWREKG